MKKIFTKQHSIKAIKFIGTRVAGTLIVVITAGTSLWALAAFTEPTTGPAASIQDFATNVLGANNADNSFDSSSVTANADGSVLERLEDLGDTDYVTCVNVYLQWYSGNYPSCPSGFVSLSQGSWRTESTDSQSYVNWRACCLPR